ncbi:6706_t:CDS:2 [Racocetra persica]|uniref:6706_t:CDS:1 n=1 Tax=Racocetra persica TaxID=160502 RepID=A0ACA9LYC6_9GLOM|nr:6706_t:CDS:2 [Racocetra persica]
MGRSTTSPLISSFTTTLVLQRNGYQVRILSEYWPSDLNINYSSPWAAAAWRANLHIDDKRVHETGLMRVQIYNFMNKKPELKGDIWFRDFVPEFRVIPPKELPSGVEYRVSYTTVYLSHINESFFDDDDINVVINCIGVNAKTFGGVMDTPVFPSHG